MNNIIVLGNPGQQYELTRHNYAWLVADRIEEQMKAKTRSHFSSYQVVKGKIRKAEVSLVRPITYMNHSGIAVDQYLNKTTCSLDEILVVHDDLDIPFGSIRLKFGGGDGGHKGLRSLLLELKEDAFLRMRLGIQPAEQPNSPVDFVLSPFDDNELSALDSLIGKAASIAQQVLFTDYKLVMNQVNRRKVQD